MAPEHLHQRHHHSVTTTFAGIISHAPRLVHSRTVISLVPTIADELKWRSEQWSDLVGRLDIPPSELRQRGIYGSGRGVWRDLSRTCLLGDASGYAVSVLHRGVRYADDLFDDGVIYHFPETDSPSTDIGEIQSLRNVATNNLPVFVISNGRLTTTRRVQLGFVSEFQNDRCLILFSDKPDSSSVFPVDLETTPFVMNDRRKKQRRTVTTAARSAAFKFRVEARCGLECAFCDVTNAELLDAAHIIPVSEGGPDDPRNGLVLCANHHRAFDRHLLCVDPDNLNVCIAVGLSVDALGVTKSSILSAISPAREALQHRYKSFVTST